MFLSTSINVLFTHDPTSYVAFFTPSCLNKGFVVVCCCLNRLSSNTLCHPVQDSMNQLMNHQIKLMGWKRII